jgi:hypothetical protein
MQRKRRTLESLHEQIVNTIGKMADQLEKVSATLTLRALQPLRAAHIVDSS